MHPLLLRTASIGLLTLALSACGEAPAPSLTDDTTSDITYTPLTVATELGRDFSRKQSSETVEFTVIAEAKHGLRKPRDLDFNPREPDQLWIVNNGDDGMVIVHDASQDSRTREHRIDDAANHFMAFPSSLAFGADETTIGLPGTFGTCQESRNTYGGQAPANDFMGPALWSSDLTVFAAQNPFGLGSHLDMLHGSPNCMGIAHQEANIYWAFGGKIGNSTFDPVPAIVKYNFNQDHGVGQDDHADGEIYQYATNEVQYVPGIPSHLFFDHSDRMLYIADTGNSRVVALDTESGTAGSNMPSQEPLAAYKRMNNATLVEIVPGGALTAPSGLEVKDDVIYVSDNATGTIYAFSKLGELLNELDTGVGPGALAGINFGPDGKLYFVDMLANKVLRVDPL